MKQLLFLLLFLISIAASGQYTNDLPERKAFILKLEVDKKFVYQADIKASSYFVKDYILQFFPGENLFIEVEMEKDSIKSMKSVKENKNPAKTIILSFKQVTEKQKHQNMMLEVYNPFKQSLSYHALIHLMESDKWIQTSIIPVEPGLSGFETWPQIIISIALADWQLK